MVNAVEITLDGERLMAASMDAMAITDGDRHVAVNQSYAELYGFIDPDELADKLWVDRLAADDPVQFKAEILSTCRRDGQWRGIVTGRRRDDSTVPQELSIIQLDGGHFLCTIREAETIDSDDRERNVEQYATIIETVADGVYILDEDLRFSFVNERLCEMVGVSQEDLIGTPAIALFERDDEVAAAEKLRQRVVDGDTSIGTVQGTLPTAGGKRVLEARYRLHTDVDEEFRGSVGIVRDVTEREERERELRSARQFNEQLVEHAPFGMFRLDEDLHITYENPRAEEIIGLPEDEEESAAIGVDIRELPPIVETGQAGLFTRLKDGEAIEFEFPFESIYGKEAYFTGRGVPLYRDGAFDGAVLMATDISERRQHERDLERQRDELETLDRINELLFEIARDLFGSPTRDEIEQTVCDRLAASDLYKFAWIGEPDSEGDQIVPRTSAGIDDGYVESIQVTTTETETGQGPGGRALRSGTVQVSQDVRSDPTFEPWREKALDRGVRSVAAIPLVHGKMSYGILAVYAARPLGFSHREQAGFETLGKAAGFAINAIENRQLLFADTIVELEFEVTDPGLVFVRTSEQLSCELAITGYVESGSGSWSVYLTVDGAAPKSVRDCATDDPDVDQVRVIADEGDAGLVEFVMAGPALNGIMDHGAILTTGTTDTGQGRFCIEVPQSTDVRRLTARFQAIYPDSTLVAQREFDRPVQKAGEIRESMDDRLTDRQKEALLRAYHAGYFEWPRKSTAGDVADSIGIAETTFHYHLRNALETLSSALISLEKR